MSLLSDETIELLYCEKTIVLDLSKHTNLKTVKIIGCKNLESIIGLTDNMTDNLLTINSLIIEGCFKLKEININKLFNITYLILGECNFNINNNIELLDLQYFELTYNEQITELDFSKCLNLTSLILSGCINIEKITGLSINIVTLFVDECSKLDINTLIKNLNKLERLNVSKTNIDNTNNLEHIKEIHFDECINITKVHGLDNAEILSFEGCINLKEISFLDINHINIFDITTDLIVATKDIQDINFDNWFDCCIQVVTHHNTKKLWIHECRELGQILNPYKKVKNNL